MTAIMVILLLVYGSSTTGFVISTESFHRKYCQELQDFSVETVLSCNDDGNLICVEVTIMIVKIINEEQTMLNCSTLDVKTLECLQHLVTVYGACYASDCREECSTDDCEEYDAQELEVDHDSQEKEVDHDTQELKVGLDIKELGVDYNNQELEIDYGLQELEVGSNMELAMPRTRNQSLVHVIRFLTDSRIRRLMKNVSLEELEHKKQFIIAGEEISVIICAYPYIMGAEFLIGMAANGLAFFILTRYKNTHASNNVVLINLVIADIMSLFLNLPVAYSTRLTNDIVVKVVTFFRILTVFMSTYFIVFISYERLQVISRVTTGVQHARNVLKTVTLWVAGLLYSSVQVGMGHLQFIISMVYCNAVILYLIPVVLITTFSVLASGLLRRSVHKIPGEHMRHEERINNRIITSNALVGLVVLLLLSYVPMLAVSLYEINQNDIDVTNLKHGFTRIYLLYLSLTMFHLNSTFNPVLLYYMSSKFRKHFKSTLRRKSIYS